MKLRKTEAAGGFKSIMHWCPGCEEVHGIRVAGPTGPKWTFNEDYENPTFSPSILLFTTYDDEGMPLAPGERRTLCHYFIRNGKIEFCGDSPHALAGRTVDIPDWPYKNGAYGGIIDPE